ncbi:group III truncated hemoglobin [Winogradskyella sp. 3972H.M.0a.05]|uniref:group III truncated hemoglobin n=1 Tax=Winogradskyella sp. 3972H.M.0a.05 TaxID=2950277 RepID=UPI003390EC25
MNKSDISTKDDIHTLVSKFYAKVRLHDTLGPIFNTVVKDWDDHLERITLFWESNLFFRTKYFGNPLEVHTRVDQRFNNSITQDHFGQWLNLWIETIDELHQGDYADKAKFRARKMSTFLYMKIFENRH